MAWLPASYSVGVLALLLLITSAVNRLAPEPYMVAAAGAHFLSRSCMRLDSLACALGSDCTIALNCRTATLSCPPPNTSPPRQDEPFHVPATQRYCAGDLLTWDPKITTFPGLYALGAAYAWAARVALAWAGTKLVRLGEGGGARCPLIGLASLCWRHAPHWRAAQRHWQGGCECARARLQPATSAGWQAKSAPTRVSPLACGAARRSTRARRRTCAASTPSWRWPACS